MRRLKLYLVTGLLFCVQILWAQMQVTGKVTDQRDGTPIAGATVTVKNTQRSTITDAEGSFSISAPANGTLVVSSVGYQTVERPVSAGTMNVALAQGTNAMQEVVVTGYTTIQRKRFSGSTVSVDAQDVRTQPMASFDQALQGQAAGVSVVANSGQPGASAQVRIRGVGSISGGNTPLYILDGIEINAADFAAMNQGDFERVEVLKDAVATSMYGSRGANGVIVISSRRGRAGQLQLNYDVQMGSSRLPEDRLIVMNSDQKITYELQRGNPYQWTPAQQDSLRQVNFNWKDALFQTGMTQQHMLSASGGSQTSRVFGSLSFMDQQGIVKTTGLKRYTARVNLDNTINNFRFGLNVQGGFARIQGTSEANTFLSAPLNAIRWANPYERDIDPRTGDYQETGGDSTGSLYSGQPNPAMELFLNNNWRVQVKGIATSYLEFHFPFVKGLSARTNWGVDYNQNETFNFTNPRTSIGIARQGILSRAMNRNLRYTGTTSVSYKTQFGQHELDGGLFTEVVKNNFRTFGFTGYGITGFQNEAGITPGSASNPNYIPLVNGNGEENGILSYFAIVNYGYAGKYYLSAVGRRDGSSRFGVNRRFANFGSLGLTWVASQEKFMEGVTFVDDLRFRASIGTNGNQLTPLGNYPIPLFGRTSYAGTFALPATGFNSSPGNLDYTWETNQTVNFGMDFSVLQRRLSGTLEFYERKTLNLFFERPVDPASAGGNTTIPGNFGTVRNRGIELMLRGDIFKTRTFRWTLEGNVTYNRNRILALPKDSIIDPNSSVAVLAEGKPVNSLYLVEYAGVDPQNGNAMYIKRDGTRTAVWSQNDKQIWGTSDAPWYGGISTTVGYKGFDLSAQLNFFLDRQLFNNDRVNVTHPAYFFDNMSVDVLREWRKPGDLTDVPRPSSGTMNNTAPANPFRSQTTRFLEDASFWRLRNVTLGYTVPQTVLTKAKLKSARIFVQGQNWWTATKFKGFDPEVTGTSLVGAQYPALVQTTVGLSVGF